MKIREPEKSDIEDIRELSMKSWIKGFEHLLTEKEIEKSRDKDSYFSEEQFEEEKEIKKSVQLVAEVGGKAVGKIKIFWGEDEAEDFVHADEGEAQLRGMYVHPDYWRQGIGTRLLEEAEKRIPDSLKALKVESFRNDERSVNFYQDNGFEIVEERSKGPEDIPMLEEEKNTLILKKRSELKKSYGKST